MEPNFHGHRTEYERLQATSRRREAPQRISAPRRTPRSREQTPSDTGSEVHWKFTGKNFTDGLSNRDIELKGRGCGIFPRVWPDEDARISEVPVHDRVSLKYGTTALAQHGGITPRRREAADVDIDKLKREPVVWHEHDHVRSSAANKQLRPLRVAGLSTARLGYLNTDPGSRSGVEDRPPWMREDEDMPGGYHFTPSDPHFKLPESARGRGDPTRFGIDEHFTASFPQMGRFGLSAR